MQDSPFNIKELEKQLQKITSGNTELVKLTIRLNEELKTKNLELQDIIESLPQGLIATYTGCYSPVVFIYIFKDFFLI